MAYDPVHRRLACTSHSGKLRVLRLEREGKPLYIARNTHVLNGAGTLGGLLNVDNGKGIPRAVIFGNGGQRITVYCLKTGEQ